ncbi:hypothetical protein O181_054130 [Austropuccinia psidii MF-1]|uniref:Uncharacterized protein n=1 Tax=Austropuccinia psidii MF-1 TaxID=1389203 RepID=A0A9Q3E872_9BASI|nr:hypothetical protein [Austropuccinia psidii MF-1]
MAYIHGTATEMTVCIDNTKHPLIIDSGAHCSIVARNYLDNHLPNWEKKLFPSEEKNFKSSSQKMKSVGTISKDIIISHRKGNITLNAEVLVLEGSHIQGFLLEKDYQRMYGIYIYKSQNRHFSIGTKNAERFPLDILQFSSQDLLEELINELKEGTLSTNLTSKQKFILFELLRKNRPAFAIGEESLEKTRGHDIELYLDGTSP